MQPSDRSAVSHASQLSPALIAARTELAEAEAHIAEAQATGKAESKKLKAEKGTNATARSQRGVALFQLSAFSSHLSPARLLRKETERGNR